MSTRILVVEDDATNADYLIRGLREEGFSVELAADGSTALVRLEQGGWDVVILDWWLPQVDGLSVLKRYRASGGTVPVLFLTARDDVPARVSGLNAGADDYLCKPFAFVELLARIRALVRRPAIPTDTYLRFADLSLDLLSRTALRGGHKLDLTAKEEALLAFLLRHPGEVLTRTRIYEQVWDERFDGVSNTLEVHVMELRRKLEARGPRLIQTVRGRGYRLAAEENV